MNKPLQYFEFMKKLRYDLPNNIYEEVTLKASFSGNQENVVVVHENGGGELMRGGFCMLVGDPIGNPMVPIWSHKLKGIPNRYHSTLGVWSGCTVSVGIEKMGSKYIVLYRIVDISKSECDGKNIPICRLEPLFIYSRNRVGSEETKILYPMVIDQMKFSTAHMLFKNTYFKLNCEYCTEAIHIKKFNMINQRHEHVVLTGELKEMQEDDIFQKECALKLDADDDFQKSMGDLEKLSSYMRNNLQDFKHKKLHIRLLGHYVEKLACEILMVYDDKIVFGARPTIIEDDMESYQYKYLLSRVFNRLGHSEAIDHLVCQKTEVTDCVTMNRGVWIEYRGN